jgi:transcriptional repressor NrdR
MKCVFCGSEQSSVIDKRAVRSTGEIRRRRECLKCHQRFTTYEKVGAFELYVLKRDGSKQIFDKNKIRSGLEKALEKRPLFEKLEEVVDKVLNRLKLKGKKEIDSKLIGQAVLAELKKSDQVAYLRFVSVYRQFKGIGDFEKELKHLN